MKKAILLLVCLFIPTSVWAGDLEWSGLYRIEANHIKNSELNNSKREKNYGLHHLILRPKIVAADGLTIYSQFNIFNISPGATSVYANSQMGQLWGNGVGDAAPSTDRDSNSLSQQQEAESIQVTQLYMTYSQEFGQLLVGRAPLHFGLGITHNAGRGLFDHWYDTRDMVAYKIIMGSIYLMPMIGKVDEGALNASDDVTDWMIQLRYENPETDLEMGVFYQARKAGDQGNDNPTGTGTVGPVLGGTGALSNRRQSTTSLNLYALKDTPRFRVGFEASFTEGDTGVTTAAGEKVNMSGFGAALEAEYRPEDSAWKWGLVSGMASGDDPTSNGDFEGFIFDKNYDVAFLMFNHVLGQRDFFRTAAVGGGPNAAGQSEFADVEAISNAIFVSPRAHYQWKDQWALQTVLTTGWLQEDPVTGQKDKGLGYELDFNLHFMPKKGVTWINQVGLLFPGSAFEGDGTLDSKFAYGLSTKAAISF